jgi:hypothetical protein
MKLRADSAGREKERRGERKRAPEHRPS